VEQEETNTQQHVHTHKYEADTSYEKRDEKRDFMHHSWKPLAATVYLFICIFDFVIVPAWIGFSRDPLEQKILVDSMQGLEPQVQMEIVRTYSEHYRWESMTMQYGGIFHLAFGAILTGVAVTGYRGGIGSKPPGG
jgi:hypothetical protein